MRASERFAKSRKEGRNIQGVSDPVAKVARSDVIASDMPESAC